MQFAVKTLEKTFTKYCELNYLLYFPQQCKINSSSEWPLVIFLHGAGERGTNLELVRRRGLVLKVEQDGNCPFIMVAPQCPVDQTWDLILDELNCLLEELIDKYPIDRKRIYLTGLSMGGYGTWHWGANQPNAFAALVPICGGTRSLLGFPERIAVLKHVPIWAFHGAEDQVISVKESEKLVSVLQNLQAPIRFTKYAGIGHNSWNKAYREPELFTWLLQQVNPNFAFKR